ncbi:MAG TPA: helix-turn-helix transcriptional regulator [Micavibrio sp.]
MITREQIKAARALLDWSQKTLAEKSGVSEPTIKLIETARINSKPDTLIQIQETIESAGIEFLLQNGVRFRNDLVTVLEKRHVDDDVYLRLLDDIYDTVKDSKQEVLHSFIDNALSPEAVINRELMIRKTGAPNRHLVRHNDTYLIYPLDEYRYLPKGYYINNPTAVYGDKFAVVVQDAQFDQDARNSHINKVVIIKNPDIANVKRMEFEILWNAGAAPVKTTAKTRYD